MTVLRDCCQARVALLPADPSFASGLTAWELQMDRTAGNEESSFPENAGESRLIGQGQKGEGRVEQ